MTKLDKLYDIRDGKIEDKNFIMSTVLRGLYYGESVFSDVPKDIFMENYKATVEQMLNNSIIQVACLKDDKDVILGYSILSLDFETIHYVFVKSAWRNQGIARSLVPMYPLYASHLTSLGKKLLTKFDNCKFNPFKLYNRL